MDHQNNRRMYIPEARQQAKNQPSRYTGASRLLIPVIYHISSRDALCDHHCAFLIGIAEEIITIARNQREQFIL